MINSDRQTVKLMRMLEFWREDRERNKETSREMVIILKWNLNNWFFYLYIFFILIIKYSSVI